MIIIKNVFMEPNTEAELLKQTELKWNKAIEDNLVEEMSKYMDEEWIIFSGDGNITTKEMFLTLVRKGELVHTEMNFEILQVKVYNDTGLIMQRGTSAGTWQGQSFSNYEIASTVFIKKNNKWLAVQTMIAPANK
jgi:hypothetical protein